MAPTDPPEAARPAWRRLGTRAVRWTKALASTAAVVAVLAGAWAGYLRLSGNFHAVESGAIYRSAQLSGSQFADRIRENGIRSILNLRGNNAGSAWYDDEVRVSATAGVRHVDFPISARRDLTDREVRDIVGLLRDLPRPILVHCEGGADRSGLVSAIYELVLEKRTVAEAAGQLSFRFGHFPWLGSATVAMDRTFERVASGRPDAATD